MGKIYFKTLKICSFWDKEIKMMQCNAPLMLSFLAILVYFSTLFFLNFYF